MSYRDIEVAAVPDTALCTLPVLVPVVFVFVFVFVFVLVPVGQIVAITVK